jgi:uncharacterized NAD(P)/FAD-binding protein YdhS
MHTNQAMYRDDARTIAIIGGGAAGALTAFHLLRSETGNRTDIRVVLVEPRAAVGLGLAYSTPSLLHLLNVPAGKISAIPDQPRHFLDWLRAHHDPDADAATFAPRAVFGRYVQSLLATVSGLERVQAEVVDYREVNSRAVLTLSDGARLTTDRVVLATGNFDPAPLPGISAKAARLGLYAHNAWVPATYAGLDVDAPITLIGSGLTAVDVLLRLREQGHRGVISAVSRHGVLPRRHAAYTTAPRVAIPAGTQATSLAYLRALRGALRSGVEWRAAIDSLRPVTNSLWLALPLREQRRFRRHLQRRWDVLRHRMAPTIAGRIEAELAAGTLILRAGSLVAIEERDGSALVITRKGAEIRHEASAARVINCTGPDMRYERVASPLLRSLFAQGRATSGPLGTGFRSDADGALLDAHGRPSQILFNIGPGRLGTLLESIAMPEIREQTWALAKLLAATADSLRVPLTLSGEPGIEQGAHAA